MSYFPNHMAQRVVNGRFNKTALCDEKYKYTIIKTSIQ